LRSPDLERAFGLGERFLGDGDLFLGAGEAEAFLRGEGDSLGGAFPPSFFSSAFRALPPLGFDLESFESFLVFFDFFFESRSRLESEELELESLLESLLELELELLAFLFFLSFSLALSLPLPFFSSPLLSELLARDLLPFFSSSLFFSSPAAPGAMLFK